MLKLSPHGVWLSIRGSSILYLYDKINFGCKLMFDIKNNEIVTDLRVSFRNLKHGSILMNG